MQDDYQKMQAELQALTLEVERLREVERERQRSQEQLQLLLELMTDLDLDLEGILARILKRLPDMLPHADFGIVYMHDPNTDLLVPQACIGADETVLRRIRLRPGESISGRVFQTGQSRLSTAEQILENAVAMIQPKNKALLLQGTAYAPKSICNICVPLRVGDEIIGTLTVSSSKAVYTVNDLALVEGIAGQVSRAVANAQAFKAQAESETKYRALVDNLPVAIVETTPAGQILFYNDAGLAINGYTREELSALDAGSLYVNPEDRRRLIEALRDQGHYAYEFQTRRKDGRVIWIRGTTRALKNEAGKIVSYLGFHEDITAEHRQRDQDLAVQRIRDLVGQMEGEADIQSVLVAVRQALQVRGIPFLACGINVIDDATDPPTVHANAMLEDGEWFQTDEYSDANIVLHFWRSGQVQYRRDLQQEDPFAEQAILAQAMGRPIRSVVDVPFTYGTLALNSEAPDAFAADDLAFLQVIQAVLDESFRRLHDLRALTRKEEELRRSQKMEAIGHLAGGIAHDFNNMMTLVLGHSAFLIESLATHDERREDALAIHEAADRCAKMVQQLLAFSSRQVSTPTLMDINAVIAESSKLLHRLIGEQIDLELDLNPGAGVVYIDRSQLEQVVLNLVINARDAMQNAGIIRVSTTDIEVDADKLPETPYHPDLIAGHYTHIEIADTGMGIPPEIIDQIFDPFFTTKGPGKGTGLGLSTVYGIIRQNGGQIQVESTTGQGTVFHIYLPHAAEGSTQPLDGESPTVQPGQETVLVVEDERALRRIARRQLERNGYSVLEAPDANAALAILAEQPDIHLLLTDVVLADGPDGIELAKQARVARPDVPVLFMSGYSSDHYNELEPGQILPKPFTEATLTIMVRAKIDAK